MSSTLFSQYPLLSALVWGTVPVRMHEKYAVPSPVPMRPRLDTPAPGTLRNGLFHENTERR